MQCKLHATRLLALQPATASGEGAGLVELTQRLATSVSVQQLPCAHAELFPPTTPPL